MKTNTFCISRTKGNGCNKLTVNKCIGESCSFAQTKEEADTVRQKSFTRLASLGKEHQRYIADKYYGGKYPWSEGGAEYEC